MLASMPGFAQEEEIFFPFVSQLRTEISASQVKLTWKDPPGIPGQLVIYRSDRELTAESLGQAQVLGRVGMGVQYFIDTPPDTKGSFYAVLVQTTDGTVHSVLIPFRNKTLAAVSAKSPATGDQAVARITNIHAAPAVGGGVEVTFESSNPERDLLLFRSTTPVSVPEDLLGSTSATQLDPGTMRVVSAALPGINYWFTVLDAGLYKLGQVPISRGENTTAAPVEVALADGKAPFGPDTVTRRAMPLPSLELTSAIQTGRPLPNPDVPDIPREKKVSPATEKAIAALLASAPKPTQKAPEPTVLPADQTPSLDPDAGALQGIVKSAFLGGDLRSIEKNLRAFLDLRRTPDVRARAHFYLGQIAWFDERPRDALLEFLDAEAIYYVESQPWIDACFEKLETTGRPPPDPRLAP